MKAQKPLKRHIAIQPLSHDHHHGLMLCWKIREGIKREIDPKRIKLYTDWFWENHLIPHFEEEEKFVFGILGNENKLVKKALAEHRRLRRLFEQKETSLKTLSLIEEELNNHIRFEERVLFNKIQEIATTSQLELVEKQLSKENTSENWHDMFWKK